MAEAVAPWLTVVGIGDDGLDSLTRAQRAALDEAGCIIGGARHLAMVDGAFPGRTVRWATPFAASRALVEAERGMPTVVLATGDPGWFGPVAFLSGFIAPAEMRVLPSPSAFSLAAARLGWPLEGVFCLSAHGRPVADAVAHARAGARLLVLSAGGETPAELAALLVGMGLGDSQLTVCEHMGGAAERLRVATAATFDLGDIRSLNLVAVECAGSARQYGAFGLPDDAFDHDGRMTKRPLRALALSALEPRYGALLWDVGAGCGSIAVEWARLGGRAMAIEPRADRRARIAANCARLAPHGVSIVAGTAPESLAGLPPPEAVFVGGGLSMPVFESAFAALADGGTLVAHAVTLESEQVLLALHGAHGGQLTRIATASAEPIGGLTGWRPQMPVTHWHIRKGQG